MNKVMQRVSDQGRGDCLTACLATLMDLTIDEVPNFRAMAADHPSDDQSIFYERWLKPRGLKLIWIWDYHTSLHWIHLAGTHCIFTMPSQRFEGGQHAVVGCFEGDRSMVKLTILHDPSPWNKPYPERTRPIAIGLLMKPFAT